MRIVRLPRVALIALVALALTTAASSAAAASQPTPNGYIGACNMDASWPGLGVQNGVGVQPGGGMEMAMSVDNPNGNDGMFVAVTVSGGLTGYCP